MWSRPGVSSSPCEGGPADEGQPFAAADPRYPRSPASQPRSPVGQPASAVSTNVCRVPSVGGRVRV
jgi:hypothetical protein